MKKILVIGSGRSATRLVKYLFDNAEANNWFVTVADFSVDVARETIGNLENGKAIFFNVTDDTQRGSEISDADIVISMLPASMHILVAEDCVRLHKNLVTASYVSKEIAALDEKAKKAGVLLLNEIGLDPGIDHMSAMQVIDDIKENAGKLTSFKSYCGGLVHPDYDNNPWNYKFTWNPRNVVLAGQGNAKYLENDQMKTIAYSDLFLTTEQMTILNAGAFEGYANRDSLSYKRAYGIDDISTLFRGTLRKIGFCNTWNIFVQLKMTDNSYKLENSENYTNREFLNSFLHDDKELSVEQKLCKQFNLTSDSEDFKKIAWLGLFEDIKVEINDVSPAQILQAILESKWTLGTEDKDMIVMQHQFEYLEYGKQKKLNSSLVVFGDDQRFTAMAKTVGLPVAIAAKLILNGEIKSTGVQIPTTKDIYIPVLKELKEHGINFIEEKL
ncbi:saccharopine dehydrogenase NADP-binding domain-containing protein [Flavobacteriales bacterium]|nr:saccharopine dehydrogenase NADP-binding domain-containing protein [Flavobacteriales bacterium]